MSRPVAALQQLHEDQGQEAPQDEDRSSDLHMSPESDEPLLADGRILSGHDDVEDVEDAHSGGYAGSEIEEPEWMSFNTPDGDLHNFDDLWAQDQNDSHDELEGRLEAQIVAQSALSQESIQRLVQQEVARALKEASGGGLPLRRAQLPPRRPRRGERGELVASLARQGAAAASNKAQAAAQHSELFRPVAQRLGKSVARANSAMQDASRLAREAGAVVASRAHGHVGPGSAYEASNKLQQATCDKPPLKATCDKRPATSDLDTDPKNAKTKVVHAANAMKSKMLQKMPKGATAIRSRMLQKVDLAKGKRGHVATSCPS